MSAYFPIRLNTLRADEVVTFDVYIKVGERYIHYTRLQDQFEGERIRSLKTKGVRKLFIQSDDEEKYLGYLETGLKNLSAKNVALDKRAQLAHDTLVTAAENAERTLETEEGFNQQRSQMNYISAFLNNDKGALKEVLKAAGISADTNQHSATVASLSIAVANKVGGLSPEEIFELGTAALLHDIGKSRLKFDPMKPTASMTPDELRAYKNHPQDGADMLAGKPFISPRILGLIAAHEERGNGRGYPDKKDLSKLALPYQILSMVNQFDHYCSEFKLDQLSAIDPFFDKYGSDYDDNLITVLATVLT